MANDPPKPPRKESPGAPKKADRIIEGDIKVDLYETRSVIMNFWVQPSLKLAFMQACQQSNQSPSDYLRDAMLARVEEHRARSGPPPRPTSVLDLQ